MSLFRDPLCIIHAHCKYETYHTESVRRCSWSGNLDTNSWWIRVKAGQYGCLMAGLVIRLGGLCFPVYRVYFFVGRGPKPIANLDGWAMVGLPSLDPPL